MRSLKHALWILAFGLIVGATACSNQPENAGSAPTQKSPDPSKPQSTQINAPLPDTAFRAALTVANPPARMRAGERLTVDVNVKNASPSNWPALGAADARFAITLRNRWLAPDGKKVINDVDGGASLPHDLAAGSSVGMTIKSTAPAKAGDYILEFDMVQEQVSWFRDKGSQPLQLKVRVE